MAHNSKDVSDSQGSDAPPKRHPARRTVVKGAAWTLPAVTMVTRVPMAAAASGSCDGMELTITPPLTSIEYGGVTGGGGVDDPPNPVVTLTQNGVPLAGENVTVNLSGGFKFSGGPFSGQSTGTWTTDGNGKASFSVTYASSTPTVCQADADITARFICAGSTNINASAKVRVGGFRFVAFGYDNDGRGAITPTGGNKNVETLMTDTFATKSLVYMKGVHEGLLWIDQDNRLWGRGCNFWNDIPWKADGSSTDALNPQRQLRNATSYVENVVFISGSHKTLPLCVALTADGTLYATGGSSSNSLPSALASSSPTQKFWTQAGQNLVFPTGAGWAAGDKKFKEVVMSPDNTCHYLLENGYVWGFGGGANGRGGWGSASTPAAGGRAVQTAAWTGTTAGVGANPLTGVKHIANNSQAAAAVTTDGKLWRTGAATRGGNGNNWFTDYGTLPGGRKAAKVYNGDDHMFVVMTDGTAWALGQNDSGKLGTGVTGSPGATLTQVVLPAGRTVHDVATGEKATMFLLDNGHVYFAGSNSTGGPVGSASPTTPGSTGNFNSPTKVALSSCASQIAVSYEQTYYVWLDCEYCPVDLPVPS